MAPAAKLTLEPGGHSVSQRNFARRTLIAAAALLLSLAPQAALAAASSTSPLASPTTPIVLAVERDYPPFLFAPGDVPQGISYDYTALVASKMGRPLELSAPMQLADMLEAVKSGRVNLLADVTKTAEREAYLAFSDPYVSADAVVIARKNDLDAWSVPPKPGLRVAVGKAYGVVSYLRGKFPGVTLVELATDSDVIRAVALGATDVGVLDVGSLAYLLQREPLANLEVVAETGFSYSLAFAVRKEDVAAIPMINAAIGQITPEERAVLYAKWLGAVPRRTWLEAWGPTLGAFGTVLLVSLLAIAWRRLRRSSRRLARRGNPDESLDAILAEEVEEISALEDEAERRLQRLERVNRALAGRAGHLKERAEHLGDSRDVESPKLAKKQR